MVGRRKSFSILLAVLFFSVCANAAYIDIYEDTVINNNLAEDSIVRVYNSAHIIVQSTDYVSFNLYGTSVATVYGGNASYKAYDSSVLNLYGGDFETRNPSVGYYDNLSKIYVYGENFQIHPASDDHTSVFLEGNWLGNGSTFNIYFRGLPQSFEQSLGANIFCVPEPMTISLILLGFFGVRKKYRG